jgi:hypothetical protein
MKAGKQFRRVAGPLAVMAVSVGGLGATGTAAAAATHPTATLANGVVTVTGTSARDVIDVTMGSDQLAVDFGGDGTVDAHFAMSAVQRVTVLVAGGDDGVDVSGPGVGRVPIAVNGGVGDDGIGVVGNIGDRGAGDAPVTVNAGDGNDDVVAAVPGPAVINAGAGDDSVDGGGAGIGRETVSLGDGDDTFISELSAFVGARTDIVDGGTGKDTMNVQGSFASEDVVLSAHEGHLIVTHNGLDHINSVGVENVNWAGFGGLDEAGAGDSVSVHDLTGTGVVNFTPDFSAPADGGAPNNSADQLTVTGTQGVDHIAVSAFANAITVSGLTASVTPIELNAKDTLIVNTLGGNDTVDTVALPQGLVQLQVH